MRSHSFCNGNIIVVIATVCKMVVDNSGILH